MDHVERILNILISTRATTSIAPSGERRHAVGRPAGSATGRSGRSASKNAATVAPRTYLF